MARRRRETLTDGYSKTLTNGYSKEQLEGYLTEIDTADTRLATLKSEYMNKCKGPRGDIAAIFETAKEAGIPDRSFKTLVKNRRLNRKMHLNISKLEVDDEQSYDRLVSALGDFIDLPLGRAAADRARPGAETLDSLA
jgi:hypothetical protein